MDQRTYIAGVGMIPFSKPGRSESYQQMGARAIKAALKDAGLEYHRVQQAYAGYVYGDSCSGQAALYQVGASGIPIFNVNSNCSSGSSAFYLARQAVQTGAVDCALAVGFEQMTPGALENMFPDRPAPLQRHIDVIADSMDISIEDRQRLPMTFLMFGAQHQAYQDSYGTKDETFAKIAVKARCHAANNPYAIFRDPVTVEQVLQSPTLYGKLTKLQACPPSCGAAAVIVCSERFAKQHGLNRQVAVTGHACTSDADSSFQSGSVLELMGRETTRRAALSAFEEAGLGPEDVDVIELHDCFASNEITTYEGLGLCEYGEAEKLIEDGDNTYGGRYVICPSGGLLSKGHPLGASGLAQLTELTWQLRGQADKRQVEGARVALQHNAGLGSAFYVTLLQQM